MKVETLLPLGKVDPGLRAAETPLELGIVYEQAKLVESMGFDGLCAEEAKTDPFIPLTLAAEATQHLGLTTSVAIAFARSPTVTAMAAWNLQELSGGRFTLGLGPQVGAHIRRRFGLEAHPAGPWMRDYVRAVRAVWHCWQTGTPLEYEGDHYRLNLMVPLFDPGPIGNPEIPIHLAAVNRYMCHMAGEVADGLRPHPVCTPSYIENVMLPSLQSGAEKSGRPGFEFDVCIKPLVATAPDGSGLASRIEDVRARVAFYASTLSYRAAFEYHGLGELADRLRLLSREQHWEKMPSLISDKVLDIYATVGTYDEIAGQLVERYAGLVTSAEFSIPVTDDDDALLLRSLVSALHQNP